MKCKDSFLLKKAPHFEETEQSSEMFLF